MATTRETIVQYLNDLESLRELGLGEDRILQADTIDGAIPESFPWIVIRWLGDDGGLANTSIRPFDLWGYDSPGDYSRIEKILYTAANELGIMDPTPTDSGLIVAVETGVPNRRSGLGRGQDLYDDGFEAVVIPWRCRAVASGV